MVSLDHIIDQADDIGVVGSPSSTNDLTIDILGKAANRRLVGSLGVFEYMQEDSEHYALGQIIDVIMRNIWTQDPTMRGLIRQRGRVDPITERQDTHTAKMSISSVFSKIGGTFDQSILGTVPPTGTFIKLLNSEILDTILADYKDQLFYLGNAYGTDIPLPMWFKHFGSGQDGAGEAYHLGVFGKTGSGKSYLAKMILNAYCRHPEMSIFILDPQGEFANDFKRGSSVRKMIEATGRSVDVFPIHEITLTGWDLFTKLLVNSGFLKKLGIILEVNQMQAAYQIEQILKNEFKEKHSEILRNAHLPEYFEVVWEKLKDPEIMSHIYTGKELRLRVLNSMRRIDGSISALERKLLEWQGITNLFAQRENGIIIPRLADRIRRKNMLTVIDLSGKNTPSDLYWNDEMKFITIGRFLESIGDIAEAEYGKERHLNGLVLIDEAHRLAPKTKFENPDLEAVRLYLVDAIRTTRKYGLGWMFISQTLSSLHRDIINQIRIHMFGFGLGWGVERDALRELIGGQVDSLSLYQRFRDPQSSLRTAHYSFMTIGPVSPLSFSGTPLFFNAYKFPEEFMEKNNIDQNMSISSTFS